MLKQYAKYHYGIKKHTNGTGYDNDCWVLDSNYRPLKYIIVLLQIICAGS